MRGKNWNNINEKLPDFNKLVEVKLDYQLVLNLCDNSKIPTKWKSIGRLRESKVWSIKATKGLNLDNCKPTHWKEI